MPKKPPRNPPPPAPHKPATKFPVAPKGMTLQGEGQKILDANAADQVDHLTMGRSYNNIVDFGLAEGSGFARAADYFAKDLTKAPKPTTLNRYGRVARRFSSAQAQKYTVSKLELLLAYDVLAHVVPVSGDPSQSRIHLAMKSGVAIDKLFGDCSVGDLRRAISSLKGPKKPKPSGLAPADQTVVDAMKTALTAEQGAHGASEIVEKLKGRAAVFDLLNVTVSDAKVLLAALVAAL